MNATIRHHLTSIDLPGEFVECVLKFLYVDDIVGGGELNNMKESLPWMLKFQLSLLKNVRFKKKIRPSQDLSSEEKVTPAV